MREAPARASAGPTVSHEGVLGVGRDAVDGTRGSIGESANARGRGRSVVLNQLHHVTVVVGVAVADGGEGGVRRVAPVFGVSVGARERAPATRRRHGRRGRHVGVELRAGRLQAWAVVSMAGVAAAVVALLLGLKDGGVNEVVLDEKGFDIVSDVVSVGRPTQGSDAVVAIGAQGAVPGVEAGTHSRAKNPKSEEAAAESIAAHR